MVVPAHQWHHEHEVRGEFVYCIGSPSRPGLYKIGYTAQYPLLRLCQLASRNGIALELMFYVEVDQRSRERDLHQVLGRRRRIQPDVDGGTEWFAISPRGLRVIQASLCDMAAETETWRKWTEEDRAYKLWQQAISRANEMGPARGICEGARALHIMEKTQDERSGNIEYSSICGRGPTADVKSEIPNLKGTLVPVGRPFPVGSRSCSWCYRAWSSRFEDGTMESLNRIDVMGDPFVNAAIESGVDASRISTERRSCFDDIYLTRDQVAWMNVELARGGGVLLCDVLAVDHYSPRDDAHGEVPPPAAEPGVSAVAHV